MDLGEWTPVSIFCLLPASGLANYSLTVICLSLSLSLSLPLPLPSLSPSSSLPLLHLLTLASPSPFTTPWPLRQPLLLTAFPASRCIWDLRTPSRAGWYLKKSGATPCFDRFEGVYPACDEWWWQRPRVLLLDGTEEGG